MAKVNTMHFDYVLNMGRWARCRDFTAGSDRVKDAGEEYLPMLVGQSDDSYKSYKSRAQFYNATGRTVDGMAGLVMRVDPKVDIPSQLEDLKDDVDYQGTSLFEFAKKEVVENLTVGRSGILVDYPTKGDDVFTAAQANEAGLRPYFAHYNAEKIKNWRTERVNGKTVLNLVVLEESVDVVDPKDEFIVSTITQYRVLDLLDHQYRVRIFRAKEGDKTGNEWEQLGKDFFPLMANKTMARIPFVFLGPETNTPNVQKSPISDLVDVNLGHYRNSADHEHGLHFTALPTPVITGHQVNNDEAIAIGSETFLCLSSPDASAFFMEFNGAGLAPIQTAMDKKEAQMASLGARMLAEDKKAVEAAETARIHRSGEAGVLSSLAGSVSKGITRALNIAIEWAAASGEAVFELNKDFIPSGMEPAMLRELLGAWQSGGISMPVLFDNLQRGEIIRADVELEDMQEDIDNELPDPPPTTPPVADPAAE